MILTKEDKRRSECQHNLRNSLSGIQNERKAIMHSIEEISSALVRIFGHIERIGEAISDCAKEGKEGEKE